ncbi:MAG: redoxin domain-containing protein [Verrucomicrobiales bacterium]
MLSVGDKAPDFSLSCKNADGIKQVKLSDNLGKTNTLLLFVPMAFTGVCTEEFCAILSLDAYKTLGADVIGISGDNPFAQEAWATKKASPSRWPATTNTPPPKYGIAYDAFLPGSSRARHGRRRQALRLHRR